MYSLSLVFMLIHIHLVSHVQKWWRWSLWNNCFSRNWFTIVISNIRICSKAPNSFFTIRISAIVLFQIIIWEKLSRNWVMFMICIIIPALTLKSIFCMVLNTSIFITTIAFANFFILVKWIMIRVMCFDIMLAIQIKLSNVKLSATNIP